MYQGRNSFYTKTLHYLYKYFGDKLKLLKIGVAYELPVFSDVRVNEPVIKCAIFALLRRVLCRYSIVRVGSVF